MIILCPVVDDEHGSFPHRLIIIPERTIMAFRKLVTIPEKVFVVCALCDHWVNGRIKCACFCHAESSSPCLAPALSG